MKDEALDREEPVSPGAAERRWDRLTRWGWTAPFLIVLLALSLNLAGNARTGLWDRDEPRFATAVREMRARGDWIVPTFNGEPRYHKPILIYWLMGISTALAGDSPFGARIVSSLAGTCTCLLVWGMGRRMLGNRGGFLAAMMLAVSPIMVAESKLATTDATLTLWMVGGLYCLLELAQRTSKVIAGLFWACLGFACLTKGPIAPVFLLAAAAMAWLWGWPALLVWKRLHVRAGLVGFAVLTVPWYLAIAVVTRGEFLRFAVGTQILQRATSAMEEHGGFPGYYLALSTVAFFPWSALVPAAIWGAWTRRKTRIELGLLLGWVVGPWLLLECLPTRLLHYYLPAYPACALLIAWMVEAIAGEEVTLRRWALGRLGLNMMGGIGIAGTVGLLAAAVTVPGPLRLPLAILSLLIGLGTLNGMLRLHEGATRRGVLGLGATWAAIMLVTGGWLIPSAEPYRMSRRVGQRLAALAGQSGVEPVLLNYQEPGVIYAMGRPVAGTRKASDLFELLDRSGSLLTVVTPEERNAFPHLYGIAVKPIESLEGFSLTKGKSHSLELVILKRLEPVLRNEESSARSSTLEEPLVK